MGFFGLFKKKQKKNVAIPQIYGPGQEGVRHPFMEPVGPLEQLRPPSLERPMGMEASEMHTVLTKLDLISARLETLNERLATLERALQGSVQQQPQIKYQQARQLPQW